jgi:chitodextrinase
MKKYVKKYRVGVAIFVFIAVLVGFYLVRHADEEFIAWINKEIQQKPSTAGLLPMPNSEVNYLGASASNAFVAVQPYNINIQGTMTRITMSGLSPTFDYSGNVPFINPSTGNSNVSNIQAWDPLFPQTFNPVLPGDYELDANLITNLGFPGRVDKQIINGIPMTMVRYNAGDNTTWGNARSMLNGWNVPPRTHVRWQLEVQFGNADGKNDWSLTPSAIWAPDSTGNWLISNGGSPVLFFQVHSTNQSNPPLQAGVDTDINDPTKLMMTFSQRTGTATAPVQIGIVHGIFRHTIVPIIIEAFLDERLASNGGKGLLQIWVNNTLVLQQSGPTLALGSKPHWWALASYSWAQTAPYSYTRAVFFKTAKMLVFPAAPLSAPTNLTATASSSTTVNLSWTASTGAASYTINRNGSQISSWPSASFIDSSVAAGTTYNYTVAVLDAAGIVSAPSNVAMVTTPLPSIKITSSNVANITGTSATINWTTNISATGQVNYGTAANSLTSIVTVGTSATSQKAIISGLNKATTYYYQIVATSATNKLVSGAAPIASSATKSLRTLRR